MWWFRRNMKGTVEAERLKKLLIRMKSPKIVLKSTHVFKKYSISKTELIKICFFSKNALIFFAHFWKQYFSSTLTGEVSAEQICRFHAYERLLQPFSSNGCSLHFPPQSPYGAVSSFENHLCSWTQGGDGARGVARARLIQNFRLGKHVHFSRAAR